MNSISSRPRAHRLRGLSLLLKRGHCAPTIMETILRTEASGREENRTRLIKIVSGMPGGIGDTGNECGGIVSPLVLLGLGSDPAVDRDGLPLAIARGQAHVRRFVERRSTPFCREIRGEKNRLLPCIKAVLDSPGIYGAAATDALGEAGPDVRREAHLLLVSESGRRGFHCARAVLDRLPGIESEYPELRKSTAAFFGGTACLGWTCGALTAGIMILGRRLAEIENSYLRVLRMIVLMKTGGDAFADRINAFNVTMNLGNRLARWFEAEYGGTLCRGITGTDFSTLSGARLFLDRRAAACEAIAGKVAVKVEEMLAAAEAA
jgi:hypothetical protein